LPMDLFFPDRRRSMICCSMATAGTPFSSL
jgi:hypothetical protein